MTIIAVDTDVQRLFQLEQCLLEIFPNNKIKLFFDPLRSLKFCLQHNVDVVFTKIEMPRLDGPTLARGVRSFNENAKIFFITEPDEENNCPDMCGISGCFTRPVTEETLHEIIKTIHTGGILE